ncbi:unnamed protein product [Ceutorhynchus assimilis]|uniref:PWWP domain-containing protein n=1 Tax=Ceutorhynchus assimilis TaxID=467358 RepID=A0A9N9MJG0_9CUCU|nr:unnamed protein product [Ceutorhynchus assimilis]
MVKITYKPGDKVFAKVKGYPPWPAKVVSDLGRNKFNVLFYGTQETGKIKQEDLAFYLKYKNSYVHKYVKRAGYLDAVKQIEEDIAKDGVDINQINLDISGSDIDRTLDDASYTSEKSTPKHKFHKTADNDQPAAGVVVNKAGRRKRSNVSETNSEGADSKKVRRESSSSVVENDSEDTANDDAPKKVESTADDNNDEEIASETDQASAEVPKNKEPAATEKNKVDEVEDKEDIKPYKKPKDDLEIVTKRTLNNFILYAEHVKKNPALYKEKPVETTRETSKKDIYAFKLPSGKVCGVKLYKNWPPMHTNEYERAIYDEKIANAALEAETILTNETKTFEEIEMEVVPDIEITESDLKSITELKDMDMDARKRRLARQYIESRLVKWDFKIKCNLGLDSALPDIALNTLKEFTEFEEDLDALMFKKNPHVLDTLRRLRKYVGNAREWNISDSDLEKFIEKAANIRTEAGLIYNRIQTLFPIDTTEGVFWDSFMDVVSDFRMKCKELTEDQVMALCDEPDTRLAFFDMLLIKPTKDESGEKEEKK